MGLRRYLKRRARELAKTQGKQQAKKWIYRLLERLAKPKGDTK